MSLLLKALEKSDEEKAKTEGQGDQPATQAAAEGAPTPAAPAAGAAAGSGAPAEGGLKLSGGGRAASKLGSALASKKEPAGQKEVRARRVVQAHAEEPGQTDDDALDLMAQQRRGMTKNILTVVVLVVAIAGGWFAWENYIKQLLPGAQQPGTAATGGGQQAAPIARDADATLLPLAEPIYDIQESILLASHGSAGDTGQAASNDDAQAQEEGISDQVVEVVNNIIESQLEREREFLDEQQRVLEAASVVTNVQDEVREALAADFDSENAPVLGDDREIMLAQLEEIRQPFISEDGKSYIKPTGYEVAMAADDSSDGDAAMAKPASEDKMMLAKSHDNLRTVFNDAVASYQAGDINNAEKLFRTVLAAEPTNIGALVGMSKIHQTRGNFRLAVATLLKASDYAPYDPLVVSELISVQSGTADPVISEGRLRAMLGRGVPRDIEARIHFLIGNTHAKQKNWLGARQSFLVAHGMDQSNPDIAYNLAVIFDYLNDPNSAVKMYRTALSAAAAAPSSFDHGVARDRISQLAGN